MSLEINLSSSVQASSLSFFASRVWTLLASATLATMASGREENDVSGRDHVGTVGA